MFLAGCGFARCLHQIQTAGQPFRRRKSLMRRLPTQLSCKQCSEAPRSNPMKNLQIYVTVTSSAMEKEKSVIESTKKHNSEQQSDFNNSLMLTTRCKDDPHFDSASYCCTNRSRNYFAAKRCGK